MFKKKQKAVNMFARKIDARIVSASSIDSILNKFQYEDKSNCLEIGNISPNDKFITVDMRDGADYVGDIRGFFIDWVDIDNRLAKLPVGKFVYVKVSHTVEHIEWIYQELLFKWLGKLLKPGGLIYIDTPNLEVIAKIYLENLSRLKNNQAIKYPYQDHPDMTVTGGGPRDLNGDLQPWVNYKLFSGCSPGDYHHTCYDVYWLGRVMANAGFERIKIDNGQSIRAVAFKPGELEGSSVDAIVAEMMR